MYQTAVLYFVHECFEAPNFSLFCPQRLLEPSVADAAAVVVMLNTLQ